MRAISSRACPTPRAFSPWPVCAFATGTPHAGIVLPEWLVSSSVSSRLPQEHSGTAVSLVGPRLRSQPSAAPLLRKFQFLPSPPPPLWHPAYADSSASRQTARWTHVNKGLQASMSSASTSSSYCLKNEVYKIKILDVDLKIFQDHRDSAADFLALFVGHCGSITDPALCAGSRTQTTHRPSAREPTTLRPAWLD